MSSHRCYIISMSSIRGPEAENSAAALPGELWRRRGGEGGWCQMRWGLGEEEEGGRGSRPDITAS